MIRDTDRQRILKRKPSAFDKHHMARFGVTPSQVVDAAIKFRHLVEESLGGSMVYTGKHKMFANGAVIYQVRCRHCSGLWWYSSGLPNPLCPDCRVK